MLTAVVILTFLTRTAFAADASAKWGYEGNIGALSWPSNWDTCKESVNPRQSPINIQNVYYNPRLTLPSPDKSAYYSAQDVLWKNLGLHVQFAFNQNPNILATFNDNGRERQYRLISGHFHWGLENQPGSEHEINGRMYKGELHLVHFATDVDRSKVTTVADAIMVIGIFIQEDTMETAPQYDVPAYKELFNSLSSIRKPQTNTTGKVVPADLLPNNKDFSKNLFYHYKGGLTTPGCFGVVNWVVLKTPIRLSSELIKKSFYTDGPEQEFEGSMKPQGGNYRPVQSVGTRMVWTNDPNNPTMSVTDVSSSNSVMTTYLTILVAVVVKMFL